MTKDTLADLAKTLAPNGVVFGVVEVGPLKTDMELVLLALSISYTVVRIAMLLLHRKDDDSDE